MTSVCPLMQALISGVHPLVSLPFKSIVAILTFLSHFSINFQQCAAAAARTSKSIRKINHSLEVKFQMKIELQRQDHLKEKKIRLLFV